MLACTRLLSVRREEKQGRVSLHPSFEIDPGPVHLLLAPVQLLFGELRHAQHPGHHLEVDEAQQDGQLFLLPELRPLQAPPRPRQVLEPALLLNNQHEPADTL
jgi:hypothetical protein